MNNLLRKKVIAIFFVGLALLAGVEVGLVWLIERGLRGRAGLGLPLAAVGTGLVIWSVQTLYVSGLGTPAPMVATQKLVQSGPYRYTRNPMTLGASLFYLGLAVWGGSWLVFGLVWLVFTALLTYIYVHESRELEARFGVEYLEYRRSTPFLIPRYRT